MIIVKTRYYEHQYHGAIMINYLEAQRLIYVESHATRNSVPMSEDDLDIWACDTFDVFKVEDIVSITGLRS